MSNNLFIESIYYSLQGPSHTLHPVQPQPAIPQLEDVLTPGNYQYTFKELIRQEEESHAEILEKRYTYTMS